MKLNKKQIKFLEYIQKYHNSLGWGITVRSLLRGIDYNDSAKRNMKKVLSNFQSLKNGSPGMIKKFGKPTKYLK